MKIDKKLVLLLIESSRLRFTLSTVRYRAHISTNKNRGIGFSDGLIFTLDELETAIKSDNPTSYIAPKLLKEELDYWEDEVELRWVKWSKRRPEGHGVHYIMYNSKNQTQIIWMHSNRFMLPGDIVTYSEADFYRFFPNAYWLEEIHPKRD